VCFKGELVVGMGFEPSAQLAAGSSTTDQGNSKSRWLRARATDALETPFVPTNEVWDPRYESKENCSSSDRSSGRAKQQDRGWSNHRQP